jgi:DNA polymerase-1
MKKQRFVLIDANSLIHRAYHAYPPQLSTSSGIQTNAIYGFSFLLLKIVEDLEPDFLICCFDTRKPTFRHEKYDGYKATRKPVDKELLNQFPLIKKVLKAFDITVLELEGYEADDIIGTLENDKKIKKYQKIIVTGDQDLFQLVDSDTLVYLSGRNFKDSRLFSSREVKEKLGIKPSQIVDYKALWGDPSDNIPGVPGIGKLGALKLMEKYKRLDKIYKNIDNIENRYKNKLEKGKESARMSKELAQIVKNVPIKYELEKCRWGIYNLDDVDDVFKEFEFRSLLNKLTRLENKSPVKDENEKRIVTGKNEKTVSIRTKEDLKAFLEKLKKQKIVAFALNYEGTSIDIKPVSFAFSWNGKASYHFEIGLLKNGNSFTQEGKLLVSILEDENIKKIGFDIKLSIHCLRNFDVNLKGINFDVKIAAYLLQGGTGSVNLEDLAYNYLKKSIDKQSGLQISMTSNLPQELSIEVYTIWSLYQEFLEKLDEYSKNRVWNLKKLFEEIEMPLLPILAEMEVHGISIDEKYLKDFTKKLDGKIRQIQKRTFDCIGHEFNLNSSQQVSQVLFEELDLPKSRRTRGGRYSTRAGVLEELRGTHPVIECMLEYRELSKLRSTYTDALLEAVNSRTGKIHTTFNQTVTATGRLSSSDPNLQNIPISSDLGKQIRKAFIPSMGSCLISFDYSQQELRILAHLARERNLIEAYDKDIDVHKATASKLFGKKVKDITKRERGIAKTINFAVMYGMGPRGLAASLSISFEEAQRFIQMYFEEYSAIREYFDNYIAEARKRGFAETLFGRRRIATGLTASNTAYQRASIRELTNFPIQGSAADMMKLAMIRVAHLIDSEFSKYAKMILQVHDELNFEYKGKQKLSEFKQRVKEEMENVYPLKVPLKVEVFEGKNMYEIH